MTDIRQNIQIVQEHIAEAVARSPYLDSADDVTLIAVTKNHGVEAMRQAIDEGLVVIGENRVQEAESKYDVLSRDVSWHLIGHLQSNKAKKAVRLFDLIHSVDSLSLAEAINVAAGKEGIVQDILLQVNVAKDENKFGLDAEETMDTAQAVCKMEHLRLRGLMTIAPFTEDCETVRPFFRKLRELYEQLQKDDLAGSQIDCLSMGMTHDYVVAIEEGANMVRVGTGIFGAREY